MLVSCIPLPQNLGYMKGERWSNPELVYQFQLKAGHASPDLCCARGRAALSYTAALSQRSSFRNKGIEPLKMRVQLIC